MHFEGIFYSVIETTGAALHVDREAGNGGSLRE
jgi:hypothetical protein